MPVSHPSAFACVLALAAGAMFVNFVRHLHQKDVRTAALDGVGLVSLGVLGLFTF